MKVRSLVAGMVLGLVIGSAGAALSNGGGGHDNGLQLVHSEMRFVNGNDRAVTVIHDRGILVERDVDARTITIRRADDVVVTAAVLEDTRIQRDGDRVTLAELQPGDRIKLFRLEREGAERPRLMKIFAWSAEQAGHHGDDSQRD